MDELSEFLLTIRLRSACFNDSNAGRRFQLVPVGEVAETTPTRLSAFHVVGEGSCVIWLPGGAPIRLECGDVMVYPVAERFRPIELGFAAFDSHSQPAASAEPNVFPMGAVKMVSGYFQCNENMVPLPLRITPHGFHVQRSCAVASNFQLLLNACETERGSPQAAALLIVEKIVELILTYALRDYVLLSPKTKAVAGRPRSFG